MLALSCVLDCYKKNLVHSEFEAFFQKLSTDLSRVLQTELRQIKTKLRNLCEYGFNPIQDGLFRGYSQMGRGGGGFLAPPSLKSVLHILQ